jgi:hypothetical protein
LRATASKGFGAWGVTVPRTGPAQAGEKIPFRYLALYEGLEEPVINTLRIESLRRYFGFTGGNGCGIQVKTGKLLGQAGMIELEAQNGLVDFEIPNPGWRVNQPLGMRIRGLNPHWTVGEWQIDGYSQRIYSDGRNLYRQLGMDDRDLIHLAVYPDQARTTHSVVGHPVQCDRPELIIEVTQLSTKPYAYQVAVNNPTDTVLRATLRKTMELPGFAFADTAVDVPPGGYQVVSAPPQAAGVAK